MTKWIRALLIAAAVEVPFLFSLAALNKPPFSQAVTFWGNFLVWYHIVSIPIGMSVANIWSAKNTPQTPVHGVDVVFLLTIYVSQVLLTTPLIYLLVRAFNRGGRATASAPTGVR